MSSLGIYFGPRMISIVEAKGKKVLNNLQIPYSKISGTDLEEKVPSELKVVALFKDELRRNKIEAKEASIALSGKDLIIRTFEMPLLPQAELQGAINFEVKKYIPFKVEDLISDFQSRVDRLSRRNLIVFIGIKKETLDSYLTILEQLSIKPQSIEYSGFSVLRFLKLAGLGDKGVSGIISMDLQEEDEIGFVVLEDGFPLFSRDTALKGGPGEVTAAKEIDRSAILEKLKTEIRISLDYYNRKFPTKNIQKIFFISSKDSFMELEAFIKETGIHAQFIDTASYISKPVAFSLSFIKGYSSSLFKTIRTRLKLNLFAARSKIKLRAETGLGPEAISLRTGIKIEPKIVVLSLFICLFTFFFGLYRRLPLEKEIKNIISIRPQASAVNPDSSYEELTGIDSTYKQKLDTLHNLINKRLYLTDYLDVVPRIIPKGIWLKNFSFKKEVGAVGGVKVILQGFCYLADSDKELDLVNTFLLNLKRNPYFNKYFKHIRIVSVERGQIQETTLTNFIITCHN